MAFSSGAGRSESAQGNGSLCSTSNHSQLHHVPPRDGKVLAGISSALFYFFVRPFALCLSYIYPSYLLSEKMGTSMPVRTYVPIATWTVGFQIWHRRQSTSTPVKMQWGEPAALNWPNSSNLWLPTTPCSRLLWGDSILPISLRVSSSHGPASLSAGTWHVFGTQHLPWVSAALMVTGTTSSVQRLPIWTTKGGKGNKQTKWPL